MSRTILALAVLLAAAPLRADPVADLLRQADRHRLPAAAMRVDTEVALYRDGVLDKERLYTVYLKPGRRSLVLMKSPTEVGQKVLMLADRFWLLMPESQRPLRITASQKLLGEAATGDIASMTWSEDYRGRLVAEVACPAPPAAAVAVPARSGTAPCLQLELTAAAPGVTYERIDLFLEKGSHRPVKGDLFVGSGKQAKEAWYLTGTLDGRQQITAMLLLDHIQARRQTLIRYRSLAAREMPDEFFNPAALVRNGLAGW